MKTLTAERNIVFDTVILRVFDAARMEEESLLNEKLFFVRVPKRPKEAIGARFKKSFWVKAWNVQPEFAAKSTKRKNHLKI
ncbi:hypothetical protein HUK80_02800 [Flavobacterium sp. MAH-1]|uniref:Uncharacterized protein n=1 Tax=Flavobacterium agri TaxID=2743471 RepID=A0A7Y8XZU5_9FLAO|nr:hypothetical protein [Flavobacterium agri]NUY79810.1 hypothetical protein [Flavobacterium agri]NYA69835.1 hypothetical protein [Flavobacterium agri]